MIAATYLAVGFVSAVVYFRRATWWATDAGAVFWLLLWPIGWALYAAEKISGR